MFFAEDNKSLIVAMDHCLGYGPVAGLEDPGRVIEAAVEAGADGIMTSFGVIKKYRHQLIGRIPVILRLDGGASLYRDEWLAYAEYSLLHSVDTALELGVNGVIVNIFVGATVELETYKIVAKVADECLKTGLPLMVEALPCPNKKMPPPATTEAIAIAARIAFEHGADFVKTHYSGNPEAFAQRVIQTCPVPVLIAGGPKMDSLQAVLQTVYETIEVGATGVVFGRNIWENGNVGGMVSALKHIIHHNAPVDEAINAYELWQPKR